MEIPSDAFNGVLISDRELGKFRKTPAEMLAELLRIGYVDQISAKLRKRLYDLLEVKKIQFTTQILGTQLTEGRSLHRQIKHNRMNWTIPRLAVWIHHKRVLAADVENAAFNLQWDFKLIRGAFADGLSARQRCQTIQDGWGEEMAVSKYCPFDYVCLRLTLVRISLCKLP